MKLVVRRIYMYSRSIAKLMNFSWYKYMRWVMVTDVGSRGGESISDSDRLGMWPTNFVCTRTSSLYLCNQSRKCKENPAARESFIKKTKKNEGILTAAPHHQIAHRRARWGIKFQRTKVVLLLHIQKERVQGGKCAALAFAAYKMLLLPFKTAFSSDDL